MISSDSKQRARILRVQKSRLRLVRELRKHSEESIQILAESMDSIGQLSPIGVLPEDENGQREVLFGYGRVHAAQKLGWSEVDAIEFPRATKPGEAIRISVSENTVRKSMNFIEKYDVIHQYTQETGLETQAAGQELGFEQGTISKIVKSNERISDANKKFLAEAGVGFTKVYELSQAPEPLQSELVKRTIEEELTREQIRAEINHTKIDLRKFDYKSLKGKIQVLIPRSAEPSQSIEVVKEFATLVARLIKDGYSSATIAQVLKEQGYGV